MLPLSNYPVSAVSSLTIEGFSIPAAANAQGSGIYSPRQSWFLVGGYRFWRGLQNALCYTAGYATTPNEIGAGDDRTNLDALQRSATASGKSAKSIGGETITFSQKDFSDAIETTLSNYRKVILL